MAIYQYSGTVKDREDFSESGTVVANNADEARRKVENLSYRDVRIKQLKGLAALMKQFSPDIR